MTYLKHLWICMFVFLNVPGTLAVTKPDVPPMPAGTMENPYVIPQTSLEIDINGRLNDDAWQEALVIDLPYETWPNENIPASVRTEALLIYSDSHIYVGFRADDPNPKNIKANYTERDRIYDDDYIVIFLDTFNDERRAFAFRSNPVGVQADDIRLANLDPINWDAIYESKGQITEHGYTVEMSIPFNQLRFQRTSRDQIWGLNVRRIYPRNVQSHIDAVPFDRNNDSYLAQFVKIRGFEGATPGRNIEMVPTLTGARTDERPELPSGNFQKLHEDLKMGLSARWGITTNLTMNGTVNSDFSQVEADALQLDINEPFALEYEEKRPFFTEGTDYFSTRKNVVYSRTMRDPSAGIKLTGKEQGHTIGVYFVRDKITNLIFPGSASSSSTSLNMDNSSAVVRYKRDIGKNYTLGLMATDREGNDYFNRLVGFDGDVRVTKTDRIRMQAMSSSTQYPNATANEFNQKLSKFNDHFIAFEYDHEARNWGWWLDYDDADPDFRADLGFIPQVGFRNMEGGVNYTFHGKQDSWWSFFILNNELNYYEDIDGNLLLKQATFWVTYEGMMQSHSHALASVKQEVYNGNKFDLTYYTSCFGIWARRNIWFHTHVLFGDRIDYENTRKGNRFRVDPEFGLNLGKHLRLDLSYIFELMTVNNARLYSANINQVNAVYHFNVRTFFRAIFQHVNYDYNSANYTFAKEPQYKHLFTQLLFSYKINPFTVFFLGYSDNYFGNQHYDLTQSDRTLFMKLSYAWVM